MRSHGAWRHPPPVFRQSPFRARLPKSPFIYNSLLKNIRSHRCAVRPPARCPPWVVCHERRLSTTVRDCTRDEGGPFEVGNQVLISSRRKLLSSKAMVVSVAETPGQDSGRQG